MYGCKGDYSSSSGSTGERSTRALNGPEQHASYTLSEHKIPRRDSSTVEGKRAIIQQAFMTI